MSARSGVTIERDCSPTAPVANNVVMASVVRHLEELALDGAPIVVHGESGAGAVSLCRSTHARSPRRAGPFVTASPPAIVESKHEDALFGEEGAVALARGGTLVVRCFDDLAATLQHRLFSFAGNLWLIATTYDNSGRSPDQLVSPEVLAKFKAMVDVPPLRKRVDDIPELAKLFAAREGVQLTSQQTAAMCSQDWPGNVRELSNFVAITAIQSEERLR